MGGSVAASADSVDETGAGSCGLAGIGGSRGMKIAAGVKMSIAGKSVAAGAGNVAGLLRSAGDGAGGSWIAKCVVHVFGGSPSSLLLLLMNSVVACSSGRRVHSLGEIFPSSLRRRRVWRCSSHTTVVLRYQIHH